MISMLATALVVALIAGIFLRSAFHALLLVGLVLGVFALSCYAFRADPRVILFDGVHAARHEYRTHRREIHKWI
jgi:hypothetical protein